MQSKYISKKILIYFILILIFKKNGANSVMNYRSVLELKTGEQEDWKQLSIEEQVKNLIN